MVTRTMLMTMALVSSAALAGASDGKAQPPAEPRVTIGATPREITVVDDVGVGDHFPSHVPGSAPYRLPPRDLPPPPEARAEAPQPVAAQPIASQPGEWATMESPQPQLVQALPQQPQVAAAVAPTQSAPAAAEHVAPDLERETLSRASDSLLQGTCETELPRLAEIIDRTDRPAIKARAQILRARCFSQRSKLERAKAEYAIYLRDNPTGAWAAEAREVTGAQ